MELSVGLSEDTVGAVTSVDHEQAVVNPLVVYALASELLAVSLTESVTLVLKIFPAIRVLAGVAVKVMPLSDATGAADILIQVVKLSEDS